MAVDLSQYLGGTTGTWSPLGITLPDYGYTEAATGGTTGGTAFNNPAFQTTPGVYQSPYQMSSPVPSGAGAYSTPTGSGGQTLGATTTSTPTYSGSGYSAPSAPSYEDQQRSAIGGAYDSYFNSLNDILNNSLPAEQAAQQGIVNETYNQGVNQLGTQKTASTNEVSTQKATSLKDLGSNMKNLFQAGNIYLGARGAGDSSAANQYSYALTKMGSKARGDIQSQTNQRIQQIGDIYNSQLSQLDSQKNQQIYSIANWFSQSQQQIKMQLASGALQKQSDINNLSSQIYNQSMNAINQINQDAANKRNTLMSWAAQNSKDIGTVVSTLNQMGVFQPQYSMNGALPNSGYQSQSTPTPVGYGGTTTQKRDIYGNVIG